MSYTPGSLVTARGREWIVLTGSDEDTLRLRPISGSEDDQTTIFLPLETEPVADATFPKPHPEQKAGHDAALLLRDALVLSLRRGAGPFRGFGQISVVPRAYQLVPLLMALKQDPVRLLIADDVGIGKTIEAAFIARELLDRGDIERMAVLCPPHLVDQWVTELWTRFHIRAVPVTSASAARLERELPPSVSVFTAHPHTVVSLDYIKSERRRAEFLRACPELVIVDEAHTCSNTGQGRHQRYELLKGLSESKSRHMLLLTATPHSGDEAAYFGLLGLLDPDFVKLATATGDERNRLRERLSSHFVQRRRLDVEDDGEKTPFPRRQIKELTYRLAGEWDAFFEAVLDYCELLSGSADDPQKGRGLRFWERLALLRCVSSSPAAAAQALRTRAAPTADDTGEQELEDRVFDGAADALPDDDVEPPAAIDDPALAALIEKADRLAAKGNDPKLGLLSEHLGQLLAEDFNPVVFCRYIATAHYLGSHFEGRFPGVTVDVITGELTADERRQRVEELHDADRRLLIATDCLSEGINLQASFDAVVHYDLSWNPTRHEQREGRVDRFGQEKKVVRATLLYGANNPVDGTVLEVILRKAAKIKEELGVPVPLPDDSRALSQALLRAVLVRQKKAHRQRVFDFADTPEAHAIDAMWKDAREKAQRNRTVFAQQRLKPRDVLPEWEKTLAAIGSQKDVHRFTDRALARLGAALEPLRRGHKAALGVLPEDVRERLAAEGLSGTVKIDFDVPPAPRCQPVQRSHPLVSVLAETLLERTLAAAGGETTGDPAVLGRVGCWVSAELQTRTAVVLLRLRHQLITRREGRTSTLLVEEATALAWSGAASTASLEGPDALALLLPQPAADPPQHVRARAVSQALDQLGAKESDLHAFAERRAQALLADHRRVREAADARGSYSVKALLPPDVIGLFVLLPRVD